MSNGTRPSRVGVVGTGTISDTYLRASKTFQSLDVVACADLFVDRAQAAAQKHGIPKAMSPEELMVDSDVEFVLNLTIPAAHGDVNRQALEAGKSVYCEKPLALTREEGRTALELAAQTGLRVGSAPDTFLGGGLQTCRELIDQGAIGEPIGATAFMMGHGPESWHPSPVFYYQVGGGPMFDMGPYYLTALIHLMGPVRRVTGSARITFPEREIGSEPLRGQKIHVEVPTHVAGIMDFHSGAVGTLITSFDVWASQLPRIEVYGTEGTMSVPDPNTFGGPILLREAGEKEWREMPLTHPYTENSRGLGLADMATALQSGRPHRASGEMAYHVLDIMHAFHDASEQGRHIELESTCERPAPLPADLPEGVLDA